MASFSLNTVNNIYICFFIFDLTFKTQGQLMFVFMSVKCHFKVEEQKHGI